MRRLAVLSHLDNPLHHAQTFPVALQHQLDIEATFPQLKPHIVFVRFYLDHAIAYKRRKADGLRATSRHPLVSRSSRCTSSKNFSCGLARRSCSIKPVDKPCHHALPYQMVCLTPRHPRLRKSRHPTASSEYRDEQIVPEAIPNPPEEYEQYRQRIDVSRACTDLYYSYLTGTNHFINTTFWESLELIR